MPGPTGWAGAVLFVLGVLAEAVAILLFLWAAVNRNARLVIPIVLGFCLSFVFFGSAFLVWRRGRPHTSGTAPRPLDPIRQRALWRATALIFASAVFGIGGFAFVVLMAQGSMARRASLGIVPVALSSIIDYVYLGRVRELLGRPRRRFLGLQPPKDDIAFTLCAFSCAVIELVVGLFLLPR